MEELGIKLPQLGSTNGLAGMSPSQLQIGQDQLNKPQTSTTAGVVGTQNAPTQAGQVAGLAASGVQNMHQNGYQILGAPRILQ